MAIDVNSEEGKAVRKLIPLSTIPVQHFEMICLLHDSKKIKQGTVLFKKGDQNKELVYLLEGELSLQANGLEIETIAADNDQARFAIAHHVVRKVDAVANTNVRLLRIEADFLNHLPPIGSLPQQTIASSESSGIEATRPLTEWIKFLVKSRIFQQLPAINIQKLVMSLEKISFKKDDVIIKQDDIGKFFYIIEQGHCNLVRKPTAKAKEISLVQLHRYDSFGEFSLLAEIPEQTSVIALTDLILLRVNKENFLTLIKQPLLKYIHYSAIQERQGQYKDILLVDIRPPDGFQDFHLPGSVNIPFFSLHLQMKTLNPKRTIILVCDDEKTSESAAFLLIKNAYDTFILEGGVNKIRSEANEVIAKRDSTFQHSEEPTETEDPDVDRLISENIKLQRKIQNLEKEKLFLEHQSKKFLHKIKTLKEQLNTQSTGIKS